VGVIGLVLSLACGQACAGQQHDRSFTGKMWLSTDAAAAPGTIRVVLPDGTLLIDSCGETIGARAGRLSTTHGSRGKKMERASEADTYASAGQSVTRQFAPVGVVGDAAGAGGICSLLNRDMSASRVARW
jgi:hypothetical protein